MAKEILFDGSINYGNGVIGPSARDREYFNSLTGYPVSSVDLTKQITELPVIGGAMRNSLLRPLAMAGAGFVLAACGGSAAKTDNGIDVAVNTETPQATATLEAKPTVSPIPSGGNEPETFGDPKLDRISALLHNPATAGQVPEADIIKYNEAKQARIDAAKAEAGNKKPVSPEEAKPLLSAEFVPTSFEKIVQSLDLAYERHPDAVNFKSQGLTFTRESLDRLLSFCQSGDPADKQVACSGLVRITYGFYMQSGYGEFYKSAVDTFNYYRTAVPNEEPGGLSFLQIVKGELELNKLPTK